MAKPKLKSTKWKTEAGALAVAVRVLSVRSLAFLEQPSSYSPKHVLLSHRKLVGKQKDTP